MYIDFTQFQQFINRLLFNSSQSISKLKELSIDPARIVEVRYYDDNGNLQTVNVPKY